MFVLDSVFLEGINYLASSILLTRLLDIKLYMVECHSISISKLIYLEIQKLTFISFLTCLKLKLKFSPREKQGIHKG